MKRLFKWSGLLLLVLLILVLLILGLVYALAGTDSGFRRVAQEVSARVEGLELGAIEGNLQTGIKTDALRFDNDSMAIKAIGVESGWRLSCLTQRRFCLDTLIVDELQIATFPTGKPSPTTDAPIELPSIALPLDVTVKQILVKKLTFQPPGDANALVLENITLSAQTQNDVVTLDNASLRYQSYTAAANGSIKLVDEYPLNLSIRLDAADILPDTAPEGEGSQPATVSIQLTNTLRNLDINTQIDGAVNAEIKGSLQPLEKDLPIRLTVEAAQLGWPITSLNQIKAAGTSIEVDGTLSDYKVSLSTQLDGEQVPSTGLQLDGLVNTERLSLPTIEINTLDGTATGNATVSWADTLNWATQWALADVNPAALVVDLGGKLDGSVKASGVVNDGKWTVDLQEALVSGDLRGFPFNLDVALAKNIDNLWSLDKINLSNGKNLVNVSGSVSEVWDITASVKMPQLQNLLPGLAGGFDANLAIDGALEKPDINLRASSSVIKYNEILVQGISVNAAIKQLFNVDSELQVALGTVQSGEQIASNIRLALSGNRADHLLSLFADGPQSTAIDLEASGSLNDRFDWLGSLDNVDLEVPAHKIALGSPTELAWDNDLKKFSIDAHCWVTEGSNLCLQNKVVAEPSGTANITLDQYLLNRLNPFLAAETTLKGTLKVDAKLSWGDDQPGGFSANVETQVLNGGAQVLDANQERVSFTYDELTINSDINPLQVSTQLNLSSKKLGEADIFVQLDAADEQKAINGTIMVNGFDVGIAKAFLPDFDEIKGTVNIRGDLAGQLTDPRFNGEVVLDQPVVRAEILPLPITGGEIVTTIKGKRAIIDGKLLSDDGSITIDGSANWQRPDEWRADVELIGDQLSVLLDPIQDSTVNHVVNIRAQPNLVRITGKIDIPMAVIDVEDLPQGAATVSSDIIIIEDIETDPAKKQANKPSDLKLQVALNVSLGDDVKLSAYGLDARLTGDMNVRLKSPNPPQLGGEIAVVNGIY
jgi:translocation and assembly module TamB